MRNMEFILRDKFYSEDEYGRRIETEICPLYLPHKAEPYVLTSTSFYIDNNKVVGDSFEILATSKNFEDILKAIDDYYRTHNQK